MSTHSHLLDDAAVQRFIVDGFVSVRPTLPADYHPRLKGQLDALIKNEGNPGNDLVDKVPDLARLFADPAVDGALQSLLGCGYILHRHCHCHDWAPGSEAQAWHKDYPVGGHPRCHRGRWLLLFYYPQAVDPEMGPTAVRPGSQYYMEPVPDQAEQALTGEAGRVVIAHYDIWHKATANTSDRTRYMLKFLFARRAEPTAPSWNARDTAWTPPEGELRTLWRHMWHWYRGDEKPQLDQADSKQVTEWIGALGEAGPRRRQAADALGSVRAPSAVDELAERLSDADEMVRINAAYALGAQEAVEPLLQALHREAPARGQANIERGDYTDPSQLDATYGLAAVGAAAVPALLDALGDGDWTVRAAAATALGYMGRCAQAALPALAAALADENEWVRRHAAEALGYIGCREEEATALAMALEDRRPVTRWSLSADPLRESAAAALARMDALPATAASALEKARHDGEYVGAWAASC